MAATTQHSYAQTMNRLIAQHGDTTHGPLGINGDNYQALDIAPMMTRPGSARMAAGAAQN